MKKITLISILISIFSFIMFSCSNKSPLDDYELRQLKSWMTGSFSSQAQSEADTNFFNIHLEMVHIWKDRTDAFWLYVEQAAAWSLDKPYRQRVYCLKRISDSTFESSVFSFDVPLRFAGTWKEDLPLSKLTPDSLNEREGCAIILEYKNNAFVGSTVENNCTSQLRGAVYATSEVRIEEKVLTSWDRGFDENDLQVWGAESGPYIFRKLKD